jgi:hypothetical protein
MESTVLNTKNMEVKKAKKVFVLVETFSTGWVERRSMLW